MTRTDLSYTIDNEFIISWIYYAAKNIEKRKNILNIINLFPVADSDTGNNIFMTLDDTFNSSYPLKNKLNKKDFFNTISHNLLLSARGNSGIIISEVISSICEKFSEENFISQKLLADSFRLANHRARDSISHPINGTILDITNSAANFSYSENNENLHNFLSSLENQLENDLMNTKETMHVLKSAGVVDSGAYALVIIYQSLIDVIKDSSRDPLELSIPNAMKKHSLNQKISASIPYQYEIIFNCNNTDQLPVFKNKIDPIAHDIVITNSSDICAVHIHTYELAECIEKIYTILEPFNLKIHVISIY